MSVNLRAKWYEARFFKAGDSYEAASQYYASMNVIISGDQAEITMAQSLDDLSRQDLREFCTSLYANGVRSLVIDRAHGKLLPFAKIISENERVTKWLIELELLPFIAKASVVTNSAVNLDA